MTNKINTLWAESELTDDERNELITLMYDYLNPETESPELAELYQRLESRVKTLEDQVKELQGEEEGGGIGIDERYWKEIKKEEAEAIVSN